MADQEPTPYGKFVADGESTVKLASATVDLVGQHVSRLSFEQSEVIDYCARLGEWASEAVDNRGRWLQPVLATRAFETHLSREQGHPEPSGQCESSLAWAQLLFALNIRPGMKVLTWRLPPKAIKPGAEVLRLEVEGAAMCHIVNLFRIYRGAMPAAFSPESRERGLTDEAFAEPNTCELLFGTIAVDFAPVERPRHIKFVATFEPDPLEILQLERVPFSYYARHLGGTHMTFERSSLLAKYLNGVYKEVPVVDNVSLGPLPASDNGSPDSLKQRAKYYVQSTRLLSSIHQCEPLCEKFCIQSNDGHNPCTEDCKKMCSKEDQIDWSKPRLVTHMWLEELEHIKRRVTTNGGDDTEFLDFLVRSLEERPQFLQEMKQTYTEFGYTIQNVPNDNFRLYVRPELQKRLMFTDQHIRLSWTQRDESAPMLWIRLNSVILKHVHSILAELAVNGDGGRYRQLSSMAGEVEKMIATLDNFRNVPVLVLELGPNHVFWKSKFEIKGE